MARCKGCGAKINFIETKPDTWMPVEPDAISWDDAEPDSILIAEDGQVANSSNQKLVGAQDKDWFVSHFAVCPKADKFRRRVK